MPPHQLIRITWGGELAGIGDIRDWIGAGSSLDKEDCEIEDGMEMNGCSGEIKRISAIAITPSATNQTHFASFTDRDYNCANIAIIYFAVFRDRTFWFSIIAISA